METTGYWAKANKTRFSRRALIRASARAGVGATGIALVGCGDDDDDAVTQATPQAQQQAQAQQATQAAVQADAQEQAAVADTTEEPAEQTAPATPVKGGTWRTFLPTTPSDIDPYGGGGFATVLATAWSYEGLFRYASGPGVDPALFRAEPALAESYEVTDDGLTYVVHLRQGVQWHPPVEREFNADDVLFTYDRMSGNLDVPAGPAMALMNTWLGSIDKIDDYTVRFNLLQPFGPLFTTDRWSVIQPRETGDLFDPSQRIVGTGPWILDEYQTGVAMRYRRNPAWHSGPDAPYMDAVELNFIPEYATRLNQFLGGNLDDMDVGGEDIERVREAIPDVRLDLRPSSLPNSYIAYDGQPDAADAPWRDPRVRHAISQSLDRDGMLDAAYNLSGLQGLGVDVQYVWNTTIAAMMKPFWLDPKGEYQHAPGDPAMTEESRATYRYTPDEARQLLDAAGYPDGFSTTLNTTLAIYGQPFDILTELIQSFLSQIGINAELDVQDYASQFSPETINSGNFDGIVHVPRGFDTYRNYDIYYLPEAFRNVSKVDDPYLTEQTLKMLTFLDPEDLRQTILEVQEYESQRHYYTPMQLGASGIYWAYQPNVRNTSESAVWAQYSQGNESVPYYWKQA